MVNRYHNREESLVQVENNNQNYIRNERMGEEEPEDEMERMIDVMQQCPSPGTPTK